MNIKSVTPQVILLDARLRAETKQVKTEHGDEREGNGRREPNEKPTKEFLNPEEVNQVLDYLKKLEGVIQNQLSVQCLERGSRQFFVINDLDGKVVRRITAAEAWTLISQTDVGRGNLLHKTA